MHAIEHPAAYAAIAGPENWSATIRFVNTLLRGGGLALILQEPSASLPAGAFILPNTAGTDLRARAAGAGVELIALDPSERLIAAQASAVRVGLYGGGGAPFNHAAILASAGFGVEFLSDADIRAGRLAEVDVFLMPGGGERAMFGQIEPLGEAGCLAIADFVRGGGMYIGCCAGSYDCIVNDAEFLAICPSQKCLQLINAGPWRSENAVGFLGLQSPGVGVVTVRNARPDHPVMFGMPERFEIVHYNGPVLDPLPERPVEGASAAVGLAGFAGWTERFTPAEGFAGEPAGDGPIYLQQAIDAGKFAIAAGELGLGRVVAFGSHPEFGFDLAMTEWTQPARMFVNAVLWQAVARPGATAPAAAMTGRVALPAGSSLAEVTDAIDALLTRVRALQAKSIEPAPGWLAPVYSMSVFGLTPAEIWTQSLDGIVAMAGETAGIANDLKHAIAANPSAAALIDRWVLDERAPEWGQDGGYQGVRALLRIAERMCGHALAHWQVELGPPAGPYDYFEENPFHQVAGSYLAAVGLMGGALQLMRALAAETAMVGALANAGRVAVSV